MLVENAEATNGVILAINQADSETSSNSTRTRRGFNSRRGIKAIYLVRLIRGFFRAITRTVYSRSTLRLSKTILRTVSKKKVQAFKSSQIVALRKISTVLTTVVKTKITKVITVVRAEMTKIKCKDN